MCRPQAVRRGNKWIADIEKDFPSWTIFISVQMGRFAKRFSEQVHRGFLRESNSPSSQVKLYCYLIHFIISSSSFDIFAIKVNLTTANSMRTMLNQCKVVLKIVFDRPAVYPNKWRNFGWEWVDVLWLMRTTDRENTTMVLMLRSIGLHSVVTVWFMHIW